MRYVKHTAIVSIFALCAIAQNTHASSHVTDKCVLSAGHGRIAFTQRQQDADITVRWVRHGEDARITFKNHANDPGEWKVTARWDNPDVKVYITDMPGHDVVDIKYVDNTMGAPSECK